MKRLFLVFLVAVIIAGCSTYGKEIKEDRVAQIQKGTTTKNKIIEMFGEPADTFTDSAGRMVYRYEYKELRSTAKNFIPVVNIFQQESKADSTNLLVIFNNNNTVYDYQLSYKKDEVVKSGLVK